MLFNIVNNNTLVNTTIVYGVARSGENDNPCEDPRGMPAGAC
jgi:hypothetical protein